MKHIEFEVLINHFEGSLTAAGDKEVSGHLRKCRKCAAAARKLENFFGYVKKSHFEQVSQAATANLLNIFKPKKAAARKDSLIKKLVAKLAFDDWQTALSERFILSDTRQFLYKAGNFDIDLRLNFAGKKCQVSGQVFPDCEPGSAEIFSGEQREKVSLNEDCEFVFPPVKIGNYDLQISLKDIVIEIQNISLLV